MFIHIVLSCCYFYDLKVLLFDETASLYYLFFFFFFLLAHHPHYHFPFFPFCFVAIFLLVFFSDLFSPLRCFIYVLFGVFLFIFIDYCIFIDLFYKILDWLLFSFFFVLNNLQHILIFLYRLKSNDMIFDSYLVL
jgi:hypothetical protein